jgi:peptidoglycan/LPS O-acetylase OafA/YrhL
MRRILRLAPALVLTVVFFTFVTHHIYGRIPLKIDLIAVTYGANWAQALYDTNLSSLDHFWSLAVEEQYYLVWPWVILLLSRTRLGNARKAMILATLAVLIAIYRNLMVGTYSASRIYFGLDTHSDGLVLGGALSYLLRFARQSQYLPERASWLLGRFAVPGAIVGLLLLLSFITWEDPGMGRYGLFLTAVAASIIIADLVAGSHSVIRGLLSTAPFVYTGKISYGLYLWHLPIFAVIAHRIPNAHYALVAPLKFAATFVVASLSYTLVEKHFLKLKDRFTPGPTTTSPLSEIFTLSSRPRTE